MIIEIIDFFKRVHKINPHNNIGDLIRYYEEILAGDNKSRKDFAEFMMLEIRGLAKVFYARMVVLNCNIITHNHDTISRYPDKEGNPISRYTIEIPIVQRQLEFMLHLKNALEFIEQANFRNIVNNLEKAFEK